MRRDHAVAKTRIRYAWQREKAILERRHRANLRNYVDARLALAAENARLSIIREKQLARTVAQPRSDVSAQASKSAYGFADTAASEVAVWVVRPSNPSHSSQAPPASAQPSVDQVKRVARRDAANARINTPRKDPKPTQKVLTSNNDSVGATKSQGVPTGLSVFMALLMLHMPSVALGSLVTGVFLVRGHRQLSGLLFLALGAVLGVAVIFTLPW